MASESGVSTGGEDEGLPSDGNMAESDVPVVQKEDHEVPNEGHATRSGDHEALMESESQMASSHLIPNESHMAEGSKTVSHVTRKDDQVTGNGDHVILDEIHVTNRNGSHLKDRAQMIKNDNRVIDDSDEGTSTATTDAFIEPMEPIDFIETRPHRHAPYFNGAIGVGVERNVLRTSPGMQYESVLAELTETSKKGEVLSRNSGEYRESMGTDTCGMWSKIHGGLQNNFSTFASLIPKTESRRTRIFRKK